MIVRAGSSTVGKASAVTVDVLQVPVRRVQHMLLFVAVKVDETCGLLVAHVDGVHVVATDGVRVVRTRKTRPIDIEARNEHFMSNIRDRCRVAPLLPNA